MGVNRGSSVVVPAVPGAGPPTLRDVGRRVQPFEVVDALASARRALLLLLLVGVGVGSGGGGGGGGAEEDVAREGDAQPARRAARVGDLGAVPPQPRVHHEHVARLHLHTHACGGLGAARPDQRVRRPQVPHLAPRALQVPRAVVLDGVRVLRAARHRLAALAPAKEDPDGPLLLDALGHAAALTAPRRAEALRELGHGHALEEALELLGGLHDERGVPALSSSGSGRCPPSLLVGRSSQQVGRTAARPTLDGERVLDHARRGGEGLLQHHHWVRQPLVATNRGGATDEQQLVLRVEALEERGRQRRCRDGPRVVRRLRILVHGATR